MLIMILPASSKSALPSPGYYPSSKFKTIDFYHGCRNLWGPQHQRVDQKSLTICLDSNTGSGFKSIQTFPSGYFSTAIKLQPGYTAGVITSFYFLGTTPGKPYTLQTNVYIRGSGDGKIIGREMKFHLWFDPTANFHNYAILWSPKEIIFFVDDIPIRSYRKKSEYTFPLRPMWVYGSIWDASSWATEDGKYKANYQYQPFVGRASCHPVSASPYRSGVLSRKQFWAMRWAQRYYMVYNYCKDYIRDRSLTPECRRA
ncbi:hypothetical protein MKX01_036214 [Papaver californicum]|nr:hypothetical protein MKX01_036214 [Papaver californicum]